MDCWREIGDVGNPPHKLTTWLNFQQISVDMTDGNVEERGGMYKI